MRHALILLAALLAAGCDQLPSARDVIAPEGRYEPERAGTVSRSLCLLGFTAVPLRTLLSGHHLVDVTIDGRPATFVVDTGANVTVMHAPYAKRFGLEPGLLGGAAVGLGGTLAAGSAKVASFDIGPVTTRTRRIMTADLAQLVQLLGPASGGEIHGILGQDLLKKHRAVIDVAAPLLFLMPEGARPKPVAADRCTARPASDAKAKA